MRRFLAALVVVITVCLAGAAPAAAHGAEEPTNYLTELTRIDGDLTGVRLRVVALGERLELTRDDAAEVIVLGYTGEPYLRFDADGVWRSASSPATYLNEDRYAQVAVPETATANAPPDWQLVSTDVTYAWHDHRAHWMSFEEPPAVQGDRGTRQTVYEDAIRLAIDGREVVVHTRIVWVPPPPTTIWLAVTAIAGGLGVVAVAMRPGLARHLGLVAGVSALVARPDGVAWLLILLAALGVAGWGWARRRPMFTAAGALVAVAGAVQRLDAFGNSFLPGSVPAMLQRVAVAETVILGAAAASVLAARRPTAVRPPASVGA